MQKTGVEELDSHQSKSSLVTRDELERVHEWANRIMAAEVDETERGDDWLETTRPFDFTYGSQQFRSLEPEWEFQHESGDGSDQDKLIWTDPEFGLRVTCELRTFDQYPATEWVLWFENTGTDDTPFIENLHAIDMSLSHPEGKFTVHGANGGQSKKDDFLPFSVPVPSRQAQDMGCRNEDVVELGGDWLSSNRHLPFFNVETANGKGMLVGVGWSGEWSAKFTARSRQEMQVRAGLNDHRFSLKPGESVRSPRILSLFWEGERLHGHNMFRQLLAEEYVPNLRGEKHRPDVRATLYAPILHKLLGVSEDERDEIDLFDITEETITPILEPLIELGIDLYIIDAGWYPGEETDDQPDWFANCGNWTVDEEKYPRGFTPIVERLREDDVDFGLWFAPEAVGDRSRLRDDHPHWIKTGDDPTSSDSLRVELPEARKWFVDRVEELVETEGIDCYRQDLSATYGSDPSYRTGLSEIHHVMSLYELWDSITERHPELVMEGCCGGGRRLDLETLSRFHWTQKSDRWLDTESDQSGLYGANLYLPGGTVMLPVEATDDYGMWSAFAGQICLSVYPLDDDFPIEAAAEQIERYKRIRHLLSGDFYPLTPPSLDSPWIGYQFHDIHEDEGVVFLFKRPSAADTDYSVSDTFSLNLRGIDPESRYQVRFERRGQQETLDGRKLRDDVTVAITETPGAEMIHYE